MRYLILASAGILTWPTMEYILHRFVGHEWAWNSLFKQEHLKHHRIKDFFAPAIYKLALTVIVLISVTVLLSRVAAPTDTVTFLASFLGSYLFYEWTHYSFHVYPPKTLLGRNLRKHHFAHHFQKANTNFGVTNTLFDYLAGTKLKVDVVRVPRTFAMAWLLNPDGSIQEKFSHDYQIVQPKNDVPPAAAS